MHGIDPADRSVYGPQALLRAATENGQVFLFHIAGQPGRRIRILSHHNNAGGILIQTVDRPEWKRCPLGGKYIAQRIVLMPFHGMTRHIPGFIEHDQRRIFIQYRNLLRQRRSLRLFFRPAQNDPVSDPHRINGTDRPFIAKQSPRPIQPFECFNQMVGNTFPPAEKIVDGASVECGWNLKDQFAQSCPSLSLSIPDVQAFFYAKGG